MIPGGFVNSDDLCSYFAFGQIGRHNLIWYTACFATVLMITRSLIMEDYQIFDPVGLMRHISSITHYMPKHWRGAENTEIVRLEFEGLFKVQSVVFVS